MFFWFEYTRAQREPIARKLNLENKNTQKWNQNAMYSFLPWFASFAFLVLFNWVYWSLYTNFALVSSTTIVRLRQRVQIHVEFATHMKFFIIALVILMIRLNLWMLYWWCIRSSLTFKFMVKGKGESVESKRERIHKKKNKMTTWTKSNILCLQNLLFIHFSGKKFQVYIAIDLYSVQCACNGINKLWYFCEHG